MTIFPLIISTCGPDLCLYISNQLNYKIEILREEMKERNELTDFLLLDEMINFLNLIDFLSSFFYC